MEHLHGAREMKGSRVRALALNTYAGSMPSAHTRQSGPAMPPVAAQSQGKVGRLTMK